MNTFILLAIIIIPALLVIVLITRMNRDQLRRVQEMQGKETEFDSNFRRAVEGEANVIRKNETIVANSGGFAKVDLQVEVQLPGNAPYQVSTCWLVEVDKRDLVLPGRKIPVKVDPKRPLKVFPNVPWAKFWIFGK
jgi:hypothetical protein